MSPLKNRGNPAHSCPREGWRAETAYGRGSTAETWGHRENVGPSASCLRTERLQTCSEPAEDVGNPLGLSLPQPPHCWRSGTSAGGPDYTGEESHWGQEAGNRVDTQSGHDMASDREWRMWKAHGQYLSLSVLWLLAHGSKTRVSLVWSREQRQLQGW